MNYQWHGILDFSEELQSVGLKHCLQRALLTALLVLLAQLPIDSCQKRSAAC